MVRLAFGGRVSALTRESSVSRTMIAVVRIAFPDAMTVVYEVESFQFKRVGTSWF